METLICLQMTLSCRREVGVGQLGGIVGVIQGLTLGWFRGKVEEQMLDISRS